MRADRLLSMLLLLQMRGKMTAEQLATELEVSVRTIYRDLDALSTAGAPVYADRGPGGGCRLLDDYRTQLNGLAEDEVRALLAASASPALADLGFGNELKAARLKLLAALPSERQAEEAWVRQRILLDWERAEAGEEAPATLHLRTIQAAVWRDQRLAITYRRESSFYRRLFTRTVDPYALVAWSGAWRLVCAAGGRRRVFALDELVAVEETNESFQRAPDFDLAAFWRAWRTERREGQGRFVVQLRVSPAMAAELPLHFGQQVRDLTQGDGEEWQVIQLRFNSFEEARTKLLALGAGVEVETPAVLRLSMLDYAQQVVQLYSRH